MEPLEAKASRRWQYFLIATVLIIFLGYSVLVLTKPISQDEGVFLTIGKYLNDGLVPYRDLVDHKPPAIYFLLAGLFKIFGLSVWVAKIALIFSLGAASFLLKKISDYYKPGSGWLAVAIFLFLMTQFEGYYLIAEPFFVLPLLGAFWIALHYRDRAGWMFFAGSLLAIAVLFKQTAILSVISLLALAYTRSTKRIIFSIGFALPLLLTITYLRANGAVEAAWHQVVTLTLTRYPREALSYVLQYLSWNFLWTLPIWIFLILGYKTKLPNRSVLWALILLPLPFMFLRHYPHYWVQILPFVAIVAAITLANFRVQQLQGGILLFCLAFTGGKVGHDVNANYTKLQAQFRAAEVLNTAAGLRRHDGSTMLLAENQFTAYYFFLDRRPLNQFLYLTEITDADDAQQQTIDDLNSNPGTLILWPYPSRAYAKGVQEFIYANAAPIKTFPELGMRAFSLTTSPAATASDTPPH